MKPTHASHGSYPRRLRVIASTAALLFISFVSCSQPDTWHQKAPLGMATKPNYHVAGFSIGSKGYIAPAFGANDLWEFDPATNTWTQKALCPGVLPAGSVGFSIGNKGYIASSGNNSLWEYDPATNGWTRKADFPGLARSGAIGFCVGSKGYVGMGFVTGMQSSSDDFWEYNPATDSWTQKAKFPGKGRYEAVGFGIGDKGYAGMGALLPGDWYPLNDCWEYNPATDSWTQKTNCPGKGRWGAVAFTIGAKGYVGTGNYSIVSLADFWEYNAGLDVWTRKADLAGGSREDAVGFSIGGKGYLGRGMQEQDQTHFGPQDDLWEYDTTSNAWTQKANMASGPRASAVGFAISGKGYVGTGWSGIAKKDFWEYDPAMDAWTQKADFAGGPRTEATGFSLAGKGWLGQGYKTGRIDFTNDFWQYDPATNSWSGAGGPPISLARARAMELQINGVEYFGGGYYYATLFNDFWALDSPRRWTRKADFPGALLFAIGNKGYAADANSLWQYDPGSDVWTTLPGSLPAASLLGAFTIGRKGYAISSTAEVWEYDPAANSWTKRMSFPGPSKGEFGTSFSIGNKGYYGLGGRNDFWEYTQPADSSLTTTVTPTTFCPGSSVGVSFTAGSAYDPGNVFTAELSDSNGDFSHPMALATDSAVAGGMINTRLPNGILPGRGYRLRVVASNPVTTGIDNGTDLIINPPPVARAKQITAYLDEQGIAKIDPADANDGSAANCGPATFRLTKTRFTCAEIGANRDTLTVTDAGGIIAMDTTTITVRDTLPPVIGNTSITPNVLWPAEHRLRYVTVDYTAKDNCAVTSQSLSIGSNDPGAKEGLDFIVVDDHHVLLRAGAGDLRRRERTYYITITVKDISGNTASEALSIAFSPNGRRSFRPPQKVTNSLSMTAIPNPAAQYFTLTLQSNSNEPILLQVTDVTGRVIEKRTGLFPCATIRLGANYRWGDYFVEAIQGEDREFLHLVKMAQ